MRAVSDRKTKSVYFGRDFRRVRSILASKPQTEQSKIWMQKVTEAAASGKWLGDFEVWNVCSATLAGPIQFGLLARDVPRSIARQIARACADADVQIERGWGIYNTATRDVDWTLL